MSEEKKTRVRVTDNLNADANATQEAIELANSQEPPIDLSAIDGEGEGGKVLVGQVREIIEQREARKAETVTSADVRNKEVGEGFSSLLENATPIPSPVSSADVKPPSSVEDPDLRESRDVQAEAVAIDRAGKIDGDTEERFGVMLSGNNFTANGLVVPYETKTGELRTVRVSKRHWEYLTKDQLLTLFEYAKENYKLTADDFVIKRTGKRASPGVTSNTRRRQEAVSSGTVQRNVPLA